MDIFEMNDKDPIKMIYGTCFFPSKLDAYAYYKEQGIHSTFVREKIITEEIRIGEPTIKKDEKAFLRGQGIFYKKGNEDTEVQRWFIMVLEK